MERLSGAIGSWYAPFETASVLAAFFRRFSQRFPRNQGQDWRMSKEEPNLMSGTSPINTGVFIQKSLEGGGRDRSGRAPSDFPMLQGAEFGGQSRSNKSTYGLGLAQVIRLPPILRFPPDDAARWGYSRAKTQFQPQLKLARSLGVRHTTVSFFSLHMIETSLGQRLRELRDRADLSLRELAKRSGISSPFLSDIELGRRFPSEEILGKLAAALNVPVEDLKKYDNRGPIADLKRLMDSDPKLGFAFRTAVEKVKSGELTAEDIIARLSKPPRKK